MSGSDVVGLVVSLLAAGAVATMTVRAWLALRGPRVVTCPETGRPAAVELDVRRAALTAATGRAELRLEACTRWPEKAGCGQMCLSEVEEAGADCLARERLRRFYEGRTCAFCAHAVAPLHWHDHRPGLRSPEGRLVAWNDVAPVTLPAVLSTHEAVCWNCLVTETFRAEHPELVVERPPRPSARRHSPAH